MPTLSDGVITLRQVQLSDIDERARAGRDGVYLKMQGADYRTMQPFTREDAERWYHQVAEYPHYWVIDAKLPCIGYAGLRILSEYERKARYSVGIYNAAQRGHGIGTRTTQLILAYGFGTLQLHRIDLLCSK